MRFRASFVLVLLLMAGACQPGGGGEAADYPADDISIMAPADPGGGWDGTARAMAQALTDGGVVDTNVEVYNVGGAGGTIGLAQFVGDHQSDPHQLMVMGLVMVGAIRTNDAPVDLTEVTPVARLTTEWEAVVVPAASPYESFQQLVEDFQADPRGISWGGGSAGGTDHILVALIAKAAGVDPADINYVAHAGGGEAMSAILSGAVTAGVSGVSEFADQVEAGQLRWLAVSSDAPIEGVDAPTMTESGLEVVLSNWRGVVGAPAISDEQQDAVVGLVEDMHGTEQWQQALESNRWTDFLLTGDEFAQFLEEERVRVEEVLREIGLIE
ncbi:MAG: Bug family tripartite tricarboxylate transporter substrate binding protein [Acidimicrobiia bacterium]